MIRIFSERYFRTPCPEKDARGPVRTAGTSKDGLLLNGDSPLSADGTPAVARDSDEQRKVPLSAELSVPNVYDNEFGTDAEMLPSRGATDPVSDTASSPEVARSQSGIIPFLKRLSSPADPADIRIERVTVPESARLAYHSDPNGLGADRLRFMRMRLRELWSTGRLRKLLITSALPKDGKTTLAINLASALAEGGKRSVLLIDADLHRSSVASALALNSEAGLADCIASGLDPFRAIRRLEPLGWNLLAAGHSAGNATELLAADGFEKTIERLKGAFDWILFDSPPILSVTDGTLIAHQTDATLIVARAGYTPGKALDETVARVGRKRIVGVVLNAADHLDNCYARYGAYIQAPPSVQDLSSFRATPE